ncbi:MAG: sulfur carrier protein ThiS [Tannerellaceae bacterium]|jgi:thiamine biosynthesis protein ThiS|nr:sulfur carrier protein ThiS [Tannerellaceae bacterium]
MATVRLNGTAYEVSTGETMADFLQRVRKGETAVSGNWWEGIAVAVNYEVVPREQWAQFVLTEGMEMMLIHAVSGGGM